MTEGYMVWGAFVAFGSVIIFAGPRLSRYGDIISEKTGLGRNWVGIILLALVTSLPEVATSATAAVLDRPDIVFGNVYGSNLFNLLIIAILDIITPRPPIITRACRHHALTSGYAVKMMALAMLPLVLYNIPGLNFQPITFFSIDISSFLIIALYFFGMRSLFIQDKLAETGDNKNGEQEKLLYEAETSGSAWMKFIFFACLIIIAGICMSYLADIISTYEIPLFGQRYPIGQSLVGIILLAVVTSLPELTVSIGAVRLGAVDMALGNVLGSNMFNMLIIGIADLFYVKGSLLARVSIADPVVAAKGLASHLVVGLGGLFMLGIVSAELAYRKKRLGRISPSTLLLIIVFLAVYFILFRITFG